MKALTKLDLRCPRSGKAAYADKDTAIKQSNIIMRREGYEGKVPRRAYRCRDCGWWHLTSR